LRLLLNNKVCVNNVHMGALIARINKIVLVVLEIIEIFKNNVFVKIIIMKVYICINLVNFVIVSAKKGSKF
jgi:hypothetical protein